MSTPDEEPRRERLEGGASRLERRLLVGDAAPPRRPPAKPPIKPLPASGLLGRLHAFLPELQAANAALEGQAATEVAMERGSDDEGDGPVVEMDLACGLFDLKDPAALAAAEAAMAGQGVAVERFEGASTDDSDSGSGSDSSEGEEEEEEAGDEEAAAAGQRGGGGGAAAAAGGDAMQEDGPPIEAASGGAAAAGAAAAAAEQQQRQPGAGGPGRRRKVKRSKRHAGIEELS